MITLSRDQVREIDRRAIAEFGILGIVLMENAGRGAAEILMQRNSQRRPALVICGKGNNGGDGFVVARRLDICGYPVTTWPLAADLHGDAAVNFEIARRAGLPMFAGTPTDAALNKIRSWDGWIVDALFGTGLVGAVSPPFDRVIAAINDSRAAVLAIDIPSGLDCDSGLPLGPTVRADHTATFVAAKAGFANPSSRDWTGQVHVVDIGAPRRLLREYGLD